LVEAYDPKRVGIVLDTAHCGLDGEPDDMAIDIAYPRLLMVNLKNGFWKRVTGPEAEDVQWKVHWTNARQGLTSWPVVARELKKRGYGGDYCLHAEYTAEEDVERLIAEDIVYAKSLFA
jgi:sugar phosphate isomerase/epimerase